MPVLNTLSTEQCSLLKSKIEAGAALVIISEICPDAPVDDVWFRAVDQRQGVTVNPSVQYGTAQNQANPQGTRYEIGRSVSVDVSLGGTAIELSTLSTVAGAAIQTDATETTTQYIDFVSGPGTIPTHYQVAILPYTAGGNIRLDYGIVLPYAAALAENTSISFDVNTPITSNFSFASEPSPANDRHARIYQSTDGSDVTALTTIASEYLTAFPNT